MTTKEILERFIKSDDRPDEPKYGQYYYWKGHLFAFDGKFWRIVD